ncbi:NAD-dependent epimerase/dehydratase family protein, partial [Proteus mirabilis]
MKILVTGADGFIGKNLCVRLEENNFELIKIDRDSSKHDLELGLINANFIFHLAGVNRPKNEYEFHEGNASLTEEITHFLIKNNKKTPIMLSSSIQVNNDNKYGESKKLAENHIEAYGLKTDASYYIYRLPNVFGKWCRPNYNSFIATFCHNIANDIDIIINSP